jgi:hypothetical protein
MSWAGFGALVAENAFVKSELWTFFPVNINHFNRSCWTFFAA